MRPLHFTIAGPAALALAVGLYGCAPTEATRPVSSAARGGEQASQTVAHAGMQHMQHDGDHMQRDGDHMQHAAGQMQHGTARMERGAIQSMKANIARLSEEDRASVEKQRVCPVSGQMLGTMQTPVKVSVNGRDVWICCGACQQNLTSDPNKYLAKLDR